MRTISRRLASGFILWILAGGVCSGCRNEAYFGPYPLKVPTEINERSAGRTFRMPLTESETRQREQLASCETNELGRQVPCRCDYPVLTVGRDLTRLDYRLTHMSTNILGEAGEPVNVMVWVGVDVQPGRDLPNIVPDLPQVDVLMEHRHVLTAGAVFDEGFLESEWTEMEQAWTGQYFPECDGLTGRRPAPYEVLIGLSLLPADSLEIVTLEYTVRIRSGR